MSTSIRFVAEYYNTETGAVIDSSILRNDKIKKPVSINDLGYLHEEQIGLLKLIQDFKLRYETCLLNETVDCPNCGKKTSSHGTRQSNFHAVLTDHKVSIQRRSCSCGWTSPYTVDGIYGTSSHPDLVEKQVIQGVDNSYRQASRQLNAESKSKRKINNDDRIRRNVAHVSQLIEENKLKPRKEMKKDDAARKLVLVVDGSHLNSKDKESRSFEAMIATVYRPENINRIDKHHNEITKKTCVASALSDHQVTIKQLVLNACRKEGTNASVTELTCLTDGASNCWSITNSLKSCCKTLINVLDWFHITKRFTTINNRMSSELKERLEKVKWFLWHGQPENALKRLEELQGAVEDDKLLSDLQELYEYLERNKKYMVNYQEHKSANLPFTSTYAEISVNAVINARQKDNKKMQWTREGAHNILQIRSSRFSKTWAQDWKEAQEAMYQKAA